MSDEIDSIYEERGFTSRSEFIRQALRAAIDPAVTLSEETREVIRETEGQLERGETTSLDELKDDLGME
jgi:metal-responsive CopG/Arc/MetJ family transcriptional regulator